MTDTNIRMQFLGGAGTVTGSKILLEYNDKRILIDCGLFQGLKRLRLLNWEPFPVDPSTIDAILLTHAHLDHCGYIPRLVKNGFKGEIHCTHPTKDLAEIIMKDSGKIQEEEAERANKHGYTKHSPAEPLYTMEDGMYVSKFFITHDYDEWIILNEDMKFSLRNSGHILGSAMIELKIGGKILLFSGDIGRKEPLLLHPKEPMKYADLLVIESTYGDRIHPPVTGKEELRDAILKTYNRGGILMVPTFAVERAQELLFLISELKDEEQIPDIPVYLDSPMGVDATKVMINYPKWHCADRKACTALRSAAKLVSDVGMSKNIVADKTPKIVLAGSGMITGGRILHYLNNHMGNAKNTILLVGFQAVGTRGRSLVEGATALKFFGEYKPVNAEVRQISSLSAHADQGEMIDWMKKFKISPEYIFLNHGEPHQANEFRVKIEHELGWKAEVAAINKVYEIPVTSTIAKAV